MLKIINISSGYGKKQVLFNVSFQINEGDVILLNGGNGSGKSTLLKCLYNLLPLWKGEILYQDNNTKTYVPSDLINKGIVYIPQKDFYFENLSVEQNLRISGNLIPKQNLNERISEVLELTELSNYRTRKPNNLSGGERKVLAFGMALIHKPNILLFDEPFAGTDRINSEKIATLFKDMIISPKNAVIIVEHKDDAKQLFNKKITMELGSIKKQ